MRKVVTLAILLISVFTGVAGAAELFDARDAHAFDAMVVSLDRAGFRYVMTDYDTDKPVRQRQFMGQARLAATTVFDFDTTSRYWAPGHPRAIAVGDIVKIYGIQRDGSTLSLYTGSKTAAPDNDLSSTRRSADAWQIALAPNKRYANAS